MPIDSILSSDAHWNVNKQLAKKIGIVPAILLMELIFCRKKYGESEFFESVEKLDEILGVGRDARRSAMKALVDFGCINVIKKGIPAKYYYSINDDIIFELLTTSDTETHPSSEVETRHTGEVETHPTIIKKDIKNTIKKEEAPPPPQNLEQLQDPFMPAHDFQGSTLVHNILLANSKERYKTGIQSDPTNCNAIYQLLVSDDKEGELKQKLLEYEYSWWKENGKLPTAKNLLRAWDQLTPKNIPYWIRDGHETETAWKMARQTKIESDKEKVRDQRVTSKEVYDPMKDPAMLEQLAEFEKMKLSFT